MAIAGIKSSAFKVFDSEADMGFAKKYQAVFYRR